LLFLPTPDRQSAYENFLTLVESKPKLIMKQKDLVNGAMELTIKLMLEIEENEDWQEVRS
jgi:hypothetical protein